MNKEEAEIILGKLQYPTNETIYAFAVKYPYLFNQICKHIKRKEKSI